MGTHRFAEAIRKYEPPNVLEVEPAIKRRGRTKLAGSRGSFSAESPRPGDTAVDR